MTATGTPTAYAVSPDSGEHWTAEGAWRVADGIHRIPLPLPMDGLKAVNVYVIEVAEGLVLIDGGWAIEVARGVLDRGLRQLGARFGDIRRFLVTHVHRDHYTMAAVLGSEYDAEVSLGLDEKPALDLLNDAAGLDDHPFARELARAGAPDVAAQWGRETIDTTMWRQPDVWLEGDHTISVGARTLDAVHTPGHTPGHYVFADRPGGVLFAGDHVLPTITPSIGFTMPPTPNPLGDFMASLTRVRSLPDLRLLPAHGPVAPSSHARVDGLLAHHELRLDEAHAALADRGSTSLEVARQLGWTRHLRAFDELDVFNQGMAVLETKAHLELLVARGLVTRTETADGVLEFTRAG
jgi:glyoxylase-like metal-dependent hydrolase (beta-lactamase superfamily II)